MKAAHELAASIIALQEMELKTVNIENHRLRQSKVAKTQTRHSMIYFAQKLGKVKMITDDDL